MSTQDKDEPVYYGRNSSRRASKIDTKQEDIKDEATAIRLAAEMATKKATEERAAYGGGSTSSSRQRIRELLNKQRVVDEARNTESSTDETAQQAFKPDYGKMLWVFR